jgi:hypothetical protein
MTQYPNADNSPGYNYAPDPGGMAYNNARTSGTFTISADTTTTVVDADVKVGDIILITPANAKAAVVVTGAGGLTAGVYVYSVANGSFIIEHDDSADAQGSVFNYVAFPSF